MVFGQSPPPLSQDSVMEQVVAHQNCCALTLVLGDYNLLSTSLRLSLGTLYQIVIKYYCVGVLKSHSYMCPSAALSCWLPL